jgi:hypothetical protein
MITSKLLTSIAIQSITGFAFFIFLEVGIIEGAQSWVASLLPILSTNNIILVVMTIFQWIVYASLSVSAIASYRDSREISIVLEAALISYTIVLVTSAILVLAFLGSGSLPGWSFLASTTILTVFLRNQVVVLVIEMMMFIPINAALNKRSGIES